MTDKEEAIKGIIDRLNQLDKEASSILTKLEGLRGQPPYMRTQLNARYQAIDDESDNLLANLEKLNKLA